MIMYCSCGQEIEVIQGKSYDESGQFLTACPSCDIDWDGIKGLQYVPPTRTPGLGGVPLRPKDE